MYKVSEVASILNVDNTKIFEHLISDADLLQAYILRQHGVIYLSDEGVEVLSKLIGASYTKKYRKQAEMLTDEEMEIIRLQKQVDILMRELDAVERDISAMDYRIMREFRKRKDELQDDE